MIIKSHIRAGYRAAADYLKDQGKNEKIRLVEISDPDAKNLDQAFHNIWTVASSTRAKKPLHHISINPFKDERLTDVQVHKIVERCEQKYGYKPGQHQRVIVEHVLNGRQHFHVMWNRVTLTTGKAIWPGHHWKKSKQVCREMEKELGLKRPMPKRLKRTFVAIAKSGRAPKVLGRYQTLAWNKASGTRLLHDPPNPKSVKTPPPMPHWLQRQNGQDENIPDSEKLKFAKRPDHELMELLIWAWENKRTDILAGFGIHLPSDYFDP